MVMQGYDVSNWQSGYSTDWLIRTSDFLIMKATEGLDFVDGYCDVWVQACLNAGHPWGFYHFARNNDPIAEADFFVDSTINYFGEGIPVLDWEDGQSVAWVNAFVERVHSRTGIWPWIYANPWRFQLGGVNENCGRWVASYPGGVPSPDACPAADGVPVCCWQYTSTPLDKNYFYGDGETWRAYATGGKETEGDADMTPEQNQMLENCNYMLTRSDDPTGHDANVTLYDHVKWIAAVLNGNNPSDPTIRDVVEKTLGVLTQLSGQVADIQDRLDAIEAEA
jgi:hypothetical protein